MSTRALVVLFLVGWSIAFVASTDECFADNFVFTNPAADAYVLTKADISFSTNATVDDVERFNAHFAGDYLWVRRRGNEAVIRDHHVIGEAMLLFLPLDSLEWESQAIHARREQLESDQLLLDQEMSELERKIKAHDDHASANAANADRSALDGQMTELKSKQDAIDSGFSELDSTLSSQESRRKVLGIQIESALWQVIDHALASGMGEDPNKW